MMPGIRKLSSTTRIGDGPAGGGGNSAGWNGHQLSSHASDGLAAHNDWPVDETETMGPRQIRRHVALPADWAQAPPQQQQRTLFSSEPNTLACPSTASGHGQGLRSTASVGTELRCAGYIGGGGRSWSGVGRGATGDVETTEGRNARGRAHRKITTNHHERLLYFAGARSSDPHDATTKTRGKPAARRTVLFLYDHNASHILTCTLTTMTCYFTLS